MADVTSSRLDEAYEALRAWCHERPDLSDPSSSYGAFGTITAIIVTLEHILELTARCTAGATRADDNRDVAEASGEVSRHTRAAIQSLDGAYRAIATAHTITGRLIFTVVDDDLDTSGAGLGSA